MPNSRLLLLVLTISLPLTACGLGRPDASGVVACPAATPWASVFQGELADAITAAEPSGHGPIHTLLDDDLGMRDQITACRRAATPPPVAK